MKYTAITFDGKPYGVQPTMKRPKDYERYEHDNNRIVKTRLCEEWNAHLLTLPRYLRTQGLEALKDGEEFEARIVNDLYFLETRKVLAPLVNEQPKDLANDDGGFYCQSEKDGNRRCETICSYCVIRHTPKVEPKSEPVEQEGDTAIGLLMGFVNAYDVLNYNINPDLISRTRKFLSAHKQPKGEAVRIADLSRAAGLLEGGIAAWDTMGDNVKPEGMADIMIEAKGLIEKYIPNL